MKYKILCIGVVVAMLITAFLVQSIDPANNRYHQHLEANEKAACTEHDEDTFCTHLPLINIVTDDEIPDPYMRDENGEILVNEYGLEVVNEEMVGATVQYFDNETDNNHLTDAPTIEERAVIRVRGASSRKYDKQGYLLKFKEENLVDGVNVSLSGMTADSEWVLHGPFLDKTLIRNYLCYNLAGEIMEYAPNVRFCEAFLNGEYIGVYLITEKVEYNANGRINIEKTDPDIDKTAYIVLLDRATTDEDIAITTFARYAYIEGDDSNMDYMQVVYPGNTLTQAQKDYIVADISQFEKSLYSFDYNDDKLGYQKYIDVDSFVDYFLINEFTLNYDAIGLSKYIYKDVGGKLKMCVWDFNSAFDNYADSVITPRTFLMQDALWYDYLFKDKAFVDQVVERYYELRETYFNEEYLDNYIDETIAYLGEAIDRNYEKWGYSFQSEYNGEDYDYLRPTERNPRSYEEAVTQLKSCISLRIEHMDENIERLYTLCHDSLNKKYNYDKEAK